MKAQQEERHNNFLHLLATEEPSLFPNATATDCPICFSAIPAQQGVVLRECLHTFCRSDMVDDFIICNVGDMFLF